MTLFSRFLSKGGVVGQGAAILLAATLSSAAPATAGQPLFPNTVQMQCYETTGQVTERLCVRLTEGYRVFEAEQVKERAKIMMQVVQSSLSDIEGSFERHSDLGTVRGLQTSVARPLIKMAREEIGDLKKAISKGDIGDMHVIADHVGMVAAAASIISGVKPDVDILSMFTPEVAVGLDAARASMATARLAEARSATAGVASSEQRKALLDAMKNLFSSMSSAEIDSPKVMRDVVLPAASDIMRAAGAYAAAKPEVKITVTDVLQRLDDRRAEQSAEQEGPGSKI